MADIFDEQFRLRVNMHLMLCDPVSGDIISALLRYRKAAYRLGYRRALEDAAEECEMLHHLHPRESGREPNCAGLIRELMD
jgi:hypothetical protein